MDPFRASGPKCTRCGAANPDHYSPNGDLVCRACSTLSALDVQLATGRHSSKAGAWAMFVGGLLLLLVTLAWGIPQLIGSEYGTKATAKIVGLGLGIGIVLIAAGVRDLRLYRLKKT